MMTFHQSTAGNNDTREWGLFKLTFSKEKGGIYFWMLCRDTQTQHTFLMGSAYPPTPGC